MPEETCDPRALQVARVVHEIELPLATILFGSRARGDHDDRRSDIDIMLVCVEEPSYGYQRHTEKWAEQVAATAYGRPVPVETTWFPRETFQEKRRYVNTVVRNALKDGVVMAPRPEGAGPWPQSRRSTTQPSQDGWRTLKLNRTSSTNITSWSSP